MRRGQFGSATAFAAVVVTLLCGLAAPAAALDPLDGCVAQNQAALEINARIDALNAQIDAHNSQPVDQTNAAAVAAYNARADALNAQSAALNAEADAVFARLDACIAAMTALEDTQNTTLQIRTVPESVRLRIEAAKASIPANWQPPSAPGPNGWVVRGTPVEALYDALRRDNPRIPANSVLRGVPRPAVGDTDPAYPGGVIGVHRGGVNSGVSPDHIIPLAELVNMPGFTQLSAQNMYTLSRAPMNLQWLSAPANTAKASRGAAAVFGADPAWRSGQVALENDVRKQLRDLITQLLESQL